MEFLFTYRGKKHKFFVNELESVFQKASGLMFRKKSKPLLFIFKNKTNESIHSFFCVPFIAFWFCNGKVIDVKFVKPWKLSVKPCEKYDKLLEVPVNDDKFRFLFEEYRKV
ncbi:hypothetical protein GOV12_07990 [Candidatus Pacearchaeota archaeon]|nr:hypothetical protein [Candidatus Pacearchaeota archaeon]